MSTSTANPASQRSQYIFIVLIAGCAIAALSFGPRASLGLFLSPMSEANGPACVYTVSTREIGSVRIT
jgi:hypothetical protein